MIESENIEVAYWRRKAAFYRHKDMVAKKLASDSLKRLTADLAKVTAERDAVATYWGERYTFANAWLARWMGIARKLQRERDELRRLAAGYLDAKSIPELQETAAALRAHLGEGVDK